MNLISIPILADNYIWLLHNDDKECLIVDPGEAAPVLQILTACNLTLKAIMLTHHHQDHVDGTHELLQHFQVPVYGPYETIAKGTNRIVADGDNVTLLDHDFMVLALPGHTLGHIGFYSYPWFFCGDTVFSAGCGRICEGTAQQMYMSLQKINQLPPETLICCAHEYTLTNINFAANILPKDKFITGYQHKIKRLRAKNKPSLPTTLYLERKINLFLRCHDQTLQNKFNLHQTSGKEWQIFTILRDQKNSF